MSDDCKKVFERWAKNNDCSTTVVIDGRCKGRYANLYTQTAWAAWQAAWGIRLPTKVDIEAGAAAIKDLYLIGNSPDQIAAAIAKAWGLL